MIRFLSVSTSKISAVAGRSEDRRTAVFALGVMVAMIGWSTAAFTFFTFVLIYVEPHIDVYLERFIRR